MTRCEQGLPTTTTAIAKQLENLAREFGDELAIVEIFPDGNERSITREELFVGIEKIAEHLSVRGVSRGDKVIVLLPNCIEHMLITIAAWQLGACCVLLAPSGTDEEKVDLLRSLDWKAMFSVSGEGAQSDDRNISLEMVRSWLEEDCGKGDTLPFLMHAPSRGIATGGSSGKPKIVVQDVKPAYSNEDLNAWSSLTGQKAWQRQLVPGGLFYSLYSTSAYVGLFFGHTIYLMDKFSASLVPELIEKHEIQCMGLVPIMMERIMVEPKFKTANFESLESVFHSGAQCRMYAKDAWINRIGAEKVHEFYSATEMISTAAIRGDEWLKHRGSVGRAFGCTIQIRDNAGAVVPNGEIGEIFSRPDWVHSSFYLGVESMKKDEGGFCSVGDMGWLDDQGYLYISDRRSDMIVTGGKNVYTAEVENALSMYPGVKDGVVIGIPDRDWGRRVHAIIQLRDDADGFSTEALSAYLHQRLSGYKCPKTFEVLEEIPRSEVGKIRKTKLMEERLSQTVE